MAAKAASARCCCCARPRADSSGPRTYAQRRQLGLLGVGLVWLCLLGGVLGVQAAPVDEIASRAFAIGGLKTPPRWELRAKDRPSYAQMIGWMSRGTGAERSVITLVGKRLRRGANLAEFSREVNGLNEDKTVQGLRVQTLEQRGWFSGQRVQVEASLLSPGSQKPQIMRQYLFINPPFGYVLTLLTTPEQLAARLRDLEDVAQGLQPLSEVDPEAALPAPGATPPARTPAETAPPRAL